MKIFGLVGWSGSGKTTLVVRLLDELIGRGYTVSTMKHTHHNFDMDTPGKDSYEHRMAGAHEVLVTSTRRWALMHELRDEAEPDMETHIARMTPVDLLLIEGFKTYRHDKIEVHRPSVGKPFLYEEDPTVAALASDEPLEGVKIPVLDLNDAAAIADFIIAHQKMTAGIGPTPEGGIRQ
ncbi:MAG: molybdopterin-guanine dinucleotide biosynthesis protein B [Rhodospirillales bacterium]|nr:molybdopterin-guanine dinucleotide biosynthesis protein B [Rhodospirillales bacterium]